MSKYDWLDVPLIVIDMIKETIGVVYMTVVILAILALAFLAGGL